jgi:hypothetical protein
MEPAAALGENSVAGFAGARRMRAPALEDCIFAFEMVYGWGRLLFNVPNVEKLLVRSGGDIALEFARHAVQR